MQIEPYLIFNGDCEEAFKLYEKVLGGRIELMMTHGNSPMAEQTPAEWRDKILHVRMSVGGKALMGSDAPPGRYEKPQGAWVSISVDRPAEAERIFNALAEKSAVIMPMQQTFWAERFGMARDRFGTPWMINCEGSAKK